METKIADIVEAPYFRLDHNLSCPCLPSGSYFTFTFINDIPYLTYYLEHKRKKNHSKNPKCLYGQDLTKATGIWADPPYHLNLFDSYRHDFPKTEDVPIGLKNLGATCYLNSFLQSLFQNLLFREGMYEIIDQVGDEKARELGLDEYVFNWTRELLSIFGHLEFGNISSFDPTSFIQSLQLKSDEQQDPQEFNRLFMSKLEESFEVSSDRTLSSLLPSIFRGGLRYETECLSCRSVSERPSPFYDLEVQVSDMLTVSQALDSSFQPEVLEGDNQYLCEVCGGKRDAERRVVISEAPKTLFVQLMRYVYDTTTWQKKKLRDELDLDKTISIKVGGGEEVEYELVGVLYHQGISAYGGHYVADVRDWRSGKWWFYNDRIVQHSPLFQTQSNEEENLSNSSASEGQPQSKKQRKNEEEEIVIDVENGMTMIPFEEGTEGDQFEDKEKDDDDDFLLLEDGKEASEPVKKKRPRTRGRKGGKKLEEGDFSLKRGRDAYMLIYVQSSVLHSLKEEQ